MAKRKWEDLTKRMFFFSLFAGIALGYILGYILLSNNYLYQRPSNAVPFIKPFSPEEEVIFRNLSLTNYVDETKAENVEAESLERVRVLCWVMTSPSNHEKKAIHVKATWGKRCDILLFMSSAVDMDLPAIPLPVREGRRYLWGKTKEAFKYVYNHYFHVADWFLKADDDTYVIIENLKYLLAHHNSSEPLYFGWRFKHLIKQGFMSGGAGYVLSKEALRKFIVEALPNSTKCYAENDGPEDAELGKCMENVGIRPVNTRDSFGRERFFPFLPINSMIPGHQHPYFWAYQLAYYAQREGQECCSDSAISFHYVPPQMMYVIDHLIYQMRPYGIDRKMQQNTTQVN